MRINPEQPIVLSFHKTQQIAISESLGVNCRPYRSGEIVDDNGIVVKFLSGRVTFTHQLFHAGLFLCTHNVYHCSLGQQNVTDKGRGYGEGGVLWGGDRVGLAHICTRAPLS